MNNELREVVENLVAVFDDLDEKIGRQSGHWIARCRIDPIRAALADSADAPPPSDAAPQETDLLTPKTVRFMAADLPSYRRTHFALLCDNYVTLWEKYKRERERVEELETVIRKELVNRLDELKRAVLDD